jgi:predicted phosphodiesterase
MALYGILGDIHGNREALAAALSALDERGAQRIACLGDVVGYNADPEECVALVRRRCAPVIAGTHDLIGVGRLGFRHCSNNTEYSLRRTRRALSRESSAWLACLPPSATLEEAAVLVHGGVRDVQQAMTNPAHIRENAAFLRADFPAARVCFFGHSHEQRIYRVNADNVEELPTHGQILLRQADTYFINPGAIDASRKRSRKLAECALFDSSAGTLEFLRVPYDGAATEAKAAVFGYRLTPFTDHLYSLKRRIRGQSPN